VIAQDELVVLAGDQAEALIADLALAAEKFDVAGMHEDAKHYALAAYRLRWHVQERPAWAVERPAPAAAEVGPS
jgi:hypothetical protein